MAKQSDFSWTFIIVLAFAALWVVSKLKGTQSNPFSGLNNQRGLFGTDQFGNPTTDDTGAIL